MNSFPLRKFTAVSCCKISLKVLSLRLLLGSPLFAVGCDTWLFLLLAISPQTSQQPCNWPISYSISGLTESLFTAKESAVHLFSSRLKPLLITLWFAISLDEIRTRRILREKAVCKQSILDRTNFQNVSLHYNDKNFIAPIITTYM